jgi:hypothetical protein
MQSATRQRRPCFHFTISARRLVSPGTELENGGHFPNTDCKQLKSVTSIELEQCHIIKFMRLEAFRLQEIVTELSGAYGQDAYARPNMKY